MKHLFKSDVNEEDYFGDYQEEDDIDGNNDEEGCIDCVFHVADDDDGE